MLTAEEIGATSTRSKGSIFDKVARFAAALEQCKNINTVGDEVGELDTVETSCPNPDRYFLDIRQSDQYPSKNATSGSFSVV